MRAAPLGSGGSRSVRHAMKWPHASRCERPASTFPADETDRSTAAQSPNRFGRIASASHLGKSRHNPVLPTSFLSTRQTEPRDVARKPRLGRSVGRRGTAHRLRIGNVCIGRFWPGPAVDDPHDRSGTSPPPGRRCADWASGDLSIATPEIARFWSKAPLRSGVSCLPPPSDISP